MLISSPTFPYTHLLTHLGTHLRTTPTPPGPPGVSELKQGGDNSLFPGLLLHLLCAGCFHPRNIQGNHEALIRSHQFKPNVILYLSDNTPASLPAGCDVTYISGSTNLHSQFHKCSDWA